jgi:hypothetical protein
VGKNKRGGAGGVERELKVRQPEGVVQALVVFVLLGLQGVVQTQTDLDSLVKADPCGRGADVQPGAMQAGAGRRGQVKQ